MKYPHRPLLNATTQEHYMNVADAWHFIGALTNNQRLDIYALCSNPNFNNLSCKLVNDILKKAK